MSNDLDYLREKHKELLKRKAEREEVERLREEIKLMEEEGTFKSKIRNGLKSFRSKLQEKGKQHKEAGKRLSQDSPQKYDNVAGWNPAIVAMSSESEFKTPKNATEAEWKPAISKMVK
jgi:hypothetical protein